MRNQISALFLLLTCMHAFHATEEYIGRLWQNYPPATAVCNAISSNPERGFIIINLIFILISILYWSAIRKGNDAYYPFLWIWIVLQSINCVGHIVWSIYKESYTPGVITVIPILIVVGLLLSQLHHYRQARA